jgi:hypothetical protein
MYKIFAWDVRARVCVLHAIYIPSDLFSLARFYIHSVTECFRRVSLDRDHRSPVTGPAKMRSFSAYWSSSLSDRVTEIMVTVVL